MGCDIYLVVLVIVLIINLAIAYMMNCVRSSLRDYQDIGSNFFHRRVVDNTNIKYYGL